MAARCGRHYISLMNLRRTPVRAVVCGASGARASALGQGEGRARREGLPNLFSESESNKRVLYKDVESALQRACQGLPIQLDDFSCTLRTGRTRRLGTGQSFYLGNHRCNLGADTIREISQDRRGLFFFGPYIKLVHRLLTTLCDSNNSRARQGSHDARAVSVRVCRPGSKTGA